MNLTDRRRHALTHPLNGDEHDDITAYTSLDALPDGRLLQLVLAVDR